jgi:hypothetical protein
MKKRPFVPVSEQDLYCEPDFMLPARTPKPAKIVATFVDETSVRLEHGIDGEIGSYAVVVPYYYGIAEMFRFRYRLEDGQEELINKTLAEGKNYSGSALAR